MINNTYLFQEKCRIRKCQEKSRDSMESSRSSFSSSFTSFSSLEHKSPQEEPIYVNRSFSSKSPRNSPRSPAFKDIIKESIYKNVRSALMINKDENKINREMKPIHSLGSMDLCKINDLDESLRILYKLKDSPRFSYDGTENSQIVIDMKQTSKHKEFSRLSLDGKEDSLRCNLSPKFNSVQKKLDKDNDTRVSLNQIRDMEINQKSQNIVAKLMGLEPLDESRQEKALQSPRNAANMKQKIEYLMEKRLKKVQYQHSNNELHGPKLATIETKKNGSTKLSSVNSPGAQLALPNHKLNKVGTSEGAIKPPIVVLEPARKFDACFSEVPELEGPPDLEKIITSGLSNRKKDMFKGQINTISPHLQKIKADMEMKDSSSILTHDMNKSPRKQVNCQSSDSLSPRCKLRQKPSDHTPQTHPSTLSSRKNRHKQEGFDTIFRKVRVLGKNNGELHAADEYVTEIFQAYGLLHKETDSLSMFDQLNSNNPSQFVEKSNTKKLHQKLISDAVNKILPEKIDIFTSHGYTIKCLQDCDCSRD